MKYVLMGHRGVGKTSLLNRLKNYFSDKNDLQFFDLDQELGQTPEQIFKEGGEFLFRRREKETFLKLIEQHKNFIISVGAGFPIEIIPDDVHCLWVRRQTDTAGRIFVDRPRLNPQVSPLQEYLERFPERELKFSKCANEIYIMPEGLQAPDEAERKYFLRQPLDAAHLTLNSWHLQNPFFNTQVETQYRNFTFELRDDLLTQAQIERAIGFLPKEKILISYRRHGSKIREGYRSDWAFELGEPLSPVDIISFHGSNLNIVRALDFKEHIKFSPLVLSFGQLKEFLDWQKDDPEKRSFLPRSENGRWAWVRQWLKARQKINFVREGSGSSLDQPTLLQWARTSSKPEFAAVLGSPVDHSWTPVVQAEAFNNIFAIDIAKEEWAPALMLLEELGLKAAAVTAPLKQKAYEMSREQTSTVTELKSANTIVFKGDHWSAENTDYEGLKKFLASIDQNQTIAVWGGGGTLSSLQALLPKAYFFSSSTGQLRDPAKNLKKKPEVVVFAGKQEPPPDWTPHTVFDLSYREDSIARAYALRVNAKYVSGAEMFFAQAEGQRKFWKEQI